MRVEYAAYFLPLANPGGRVERGTLLLKFQLIYLRAPLKIQVSKQDKARVKNLSAAYS
ncbi:hypothetical protein NTG1052_650003 [Candidatus Nitrotoga sp. 1052]|nr:hypothetical protein NTG1052_650003 [Candidatus Nitrotoga sp. 1052]